MFLHKSCGTERSNRYRRVTLELHARGHIVNHKRIARFMREHDLPIKPPRRFVCTDSTEEDWLCLDRTTDKSAL
ncbi:IS3 family transposase [Collimonas humicola]|uniref:IS3 family transposase n=1 Tax=Collimonas humicola TaxID=2825886 RepID=UPI001B8D761F